MGSLSVVIFFFIAIAFSAIIHEYSHGWMADRLGDPTAKLAGRLTINPIAHIDPIGTLVLPAVLFLLSGGSFLFAFAKPVPVNPFNLRKKRWGESLVSFAGPGSNIVLALSFGLMIRILHLINPITFSSLIFYLGIIVYVNILLAIFNLIPIPPLDGSKLLFEILPDKMYNIKVFLQTYGIIFLFIFIFFIFRFIAPLISYTMYFLIGPQPFSSFVSQF